MLSTLERGVVAVTVSFCTALGISFSAIVLYGEQPWYDFIGGMLKLAFLEGSGGRFGRSGLTSNSLKESHLRTQ